VMQAGTRTRGNTLRYTSAAASPHAAVVHGLRPLPQLGDDGGDGRLVKAAAGEVLSCDEVRRRAEEGEDTLSCGRIALARGGLLRRRAAWRRPAPPPEL
jgi:hypothetical protein